MGADDALVELNRRLSKLSRTIAVVSVPAVLAVAGACLTLPRGIIGMSTSTVGVGVGWTFIALGVVCLIVTAWLLWVISSVWRRRRDLSQRVDGAIAEAMTEPGSETTIIAAVLDGEAQTELLRRDRSRRLSHVREDTVDG